MCVCLKSDSSWIELGERATKGRAGGGLYSLTGG